MWFFNLPLVGALFASRDATSRKEVWLPFKDEGLMLIGIDRDEPLEVVKKFKKQTGITYPLALDPGANHFSKFAHKNAGVTRT